MYLCCTQNIKRWKNTCTYYILNMKNVGKFFLRDDILNNANLFYFEGKNKMEKIIKLFLFCDIIMILKE